MQFVPYTYLIGWSTHNKWYYGSQYGQRAACGRRNNKQPSVANPANLWTTYFTSSVDVKNMRLEHGEPDVIEIRKIFNDSKTCIEWEAKVLNRLVVNKNSKWLNRKCAHGVELTEESKQKIGAKAKGRFKGQTYEQIMGPEKAAELKRRRSVHFQKVASKRTPETNPMFGKHHSDETKKNQSDNRKGVYHVGWKWITDGNSRRKLPPDAHMPSGWYYGWKYSTIQ